MPGSTLGSIMYKWHFVLLLKNFKRKACVSNMRHLSLDKKGREKGEIEAEREGKRKGRK